MDLNTLIFNGINSLEHLGVIVQSYPSINIPNEDYEQYSVIGRNGSLTFLPVNPVPLLVSGS